MAEIITEAVQDTLEQGALLHILTGVLASTNAGGTEEAPLMTLQQSQENPVQDLTNSSNSAAACQPAAAGSTAATSSTAANTSGTGAAEAPALHIDFSSYDSEQQQQQQQQQRKGEVACARVATDVENPATCSTPTVPAAKNPPAKNIKGGRKVNGKRGAKSQVVCKVDGCSIALSSSKAYYQRHRVCAAHLGAMAASVDGVESRFCQQCGKFQPLTEFDNDKRSCRSRLKRHNNRRREQRHSKGLEFTMLAMATSAHSADGAAAMPHKAGQAGAAAAAGCSEHLGDVAGVHVLARDLDRNISPDRSADDHCNAATGYDYSPLLRPESLAAVQVKRSHMRRGSAMRALEALRTINAVSSNSTSSEFEGEDAHAGHQQSPLAVAPKVHPRRVLKRGSAGGELIDGLNQHAEGTSSAAYQRFSHPGFVGAAAAGTGPRCNLFNSLAAVSYNVNSIVDMPAGSSIESVLPAGSSRHVPACPDTSGFYDRVHAGGLSRFAPCAAGGVPPAYGRQQPNHGYPNIGLPRFDDSSAWSQPQPPQQQQWHGHHHQQQQYPAWDVPRGELQHQHSAVVEGSAAVGTSAAAVDAKYTMPDSTSAAVGQRYSLPGCFTAAAEEQPATAAAPDRQAIAQGPAALLEAEQSVTAAQKHRNAPSRLHSTASGTFHAGFAHHSGRYSDLGAYAAAAIAMPDGRGTSFSINCLASQQSKQEAAYEQAQDYRTAQRQKVLHYNEQQQQQQHTASNSSGLQLALHDHPRALQQQQQQQADVPLPTMSAAAAAVDVCSNSSLQPSLHAHGDQGSYLGQVQQQQHYTPNHPVHIPEYSGQQDTTHPTANQQVGPIAMFQDSHSNQCIDHACGPSYAAPPAAAVPAAAVATASARGPNMMLSPFARAHTACDQPLQQQQRQHLLGAGVAYSMADSGLAGSVQDLGGPLHLQSVHDRCHPRFSAAGSETVSATGVLRSDLAGISLGSSGLGSLQQQLQQQQHSSGWAAVEQQPNHLSLNTHQQHADAAVACTAHTSHAADPRQAAMSLQFSHPVYSGDTIDAAAAAAVANGSSHYNMAQPETVAAADQHASAAATAAAATAGDGAALPAPDSAMYNSMSADEDFGELLELLLECDEQQSQAHQQEPQQQDR